MKQIFTLLVGLAVSLSALATTYTGDLTVTINGGSLAPVTANIDVTKQTDGTYNLSVKNFVLTSQNMYVGNINLEKITANVNGKLAAMYVDQDVKIAAGDSPSGVTWAGPGLGNIPLQMFAYFVEGKYLVVDIDIDMTEAIGQVINVHFDNNIDYNEFQLPNGDFESWTASSGEPDRWHGFKSATGSLASSASSVLEKSTAAHGGKYCAHAQSAVIVGINANGSITTGRLNAGSMTATDYDNNYSYMDIATIDSEKDKNGDPFYMEVYGKPDAVSFWFKFTQGKANKKQPNASFNAVIFDGTRYQDPEASKTYNNKVAVASNNKITTTSSWKQFTVNFDYASYASNNAEANAILLTASTNAIGGGGSSNSFLTSYKDDIYIDDIVLVYNCAMTDIKMKGNTINGFAANTYEYNFEIGMDDVYTDADFSETYTGVGSIGGHYVKELPCDAGYEVTVYAISGDMHIYKYIINLNRPSKSLAEVESGSSIDDVIIADDLVNVWWSDESSSIYATNANGAWVRLHFEDESLFTQANDMTMFTGGRIRGAYTSSALDPVIEVAAIKGTDNDVDYESYITEYDLRSSIDPMPVANQVAYFSGYFFDGKLRGLNASGHKGQSLDLDASEMGSTLDELGFQEGYKYKVMAAVTMHEPWSGAPRKAASSYDYDFQNLVAKIIDSPEEIGVPTGIEDITANADVVSTRYYTVAGMQVAEPVEGVTIVVTTRTDGTVTATKVLR